RWYIDEKQIELESETRKHPFIIRLGSMKTSISIEQTFPDLSFQLPDISFSDIHNKVNHHKAYITVNRLLKKAIQIGLDSSNYAIQKLENFMNGFINNSGFNDEKNSIMVKNPLVNLKR
ncbi:27277_t:CDS:2, partial [Dentiscutata erythropus]